MNSISKFRFLTISDIHLGNRRNPTTNIISNLDSYFENYTKDSRFANLDAIFIAGDLFDKLLDLESEDYYHIVDWLIRLMYFCHDNDIILRILLGTPSHDRHQPKISSLLYSAIGRDFDFEYVNTLKIERLKKSGLYILYVPDEYHPDVDVTLSEIKDLMAKEGITKVDISIMHGMFGYQAPIKSDKLPLHSEQEYLDLTRYFICIGHVHTFSVYERIIAQGSFDRLSHGQEEAKGAVVCTIDTKHGQSFEFIENKKAMIYKTIRISNKDLKDSIEYIQKKLQKIPQGSNIRIIAPKNNPIIQGIKELKIACLGYNITAMSTEEEKLKEQELLVPKQVILDSSYIPITIDRSNIIELITEQAPKYNLSGEDILLMNTLLQDIKDNV